MMNEGGLETPGKQHIHFLNPIRPRLSTLLICLKHLYVSISRHSALKTLKPLTENLQGWTLLRQWWRHKLHHSATHIFNRKHQPILLKDNCEHFFFLIVTSVKVFFFSGWSLIKLAQLWGSPSVHGPNSEPPGSKGCLPQRTLLSPMKLISWATVLTPPQAISGSSIWYLCFLGQITTFRKCQFPYL